MYFRPTYKWYGPPANAEIRLDAFTNKNLPFIITNHIFGAFMSEWDHDLVLVDIGKEERRLRRFWGLALDDVNSMAFPSYSIP